jgi:hypothetical protein
VRQSAVPPSSALGRLRRLLCISIIRSMIVSCAMMLMTTIMIISAGALRAVRSLHSRSVHTCIRLNTLLRCEMGCGGSGTHTRQLGGTRDRNCPLPIAKNNIGDAATLDSPLTHGSSSGAKGQFSSTSCGNIYEFAY